MPAEWVREDLGDDAAEVARMVPELRRRFPDIGDPLDLPPEQQRRYFFNAIATSSPAARALPAGARGRRRALGRRADAAADRAHGIRDRDLRLLAIGTYRDVELDVSRPLAATLERLLRDRPASASP